MFQVFATKACLFIFKSINFIDKVKSFLNFIHFEYFFFFFFFKKKFFEKVFGFQEYP